MKSRFIRYLSILSQFGLDPLRFFSAIRVLPRFVYELIQFTRIFKGKIIFNPQLLDRFDEGGATKGEYFWQDLLVAQWICLADPKHHVDVGSRVDGFVAHVASFRDLEVFDVRPITTKIPGVRFRQFDLMEDDITSLAGSDGQGYCDSLSCLHVLEHFGLARYGDSLDPHGYRRGFQNLAKLMRPGGTFYLSTPIGKQRVEFNANWVFDPATILQLSEEAGLVLDRLAIFSNLDGLREIDPFHFRQTLSELGFEDYNLGIFVFKRK